MTDKMGDTLYKLDGVINDNFEWLVIIGCEGVVKKDYTQRLFCTTLHEHNSMVMRRFNKDGHNKRMFNHIKRL